MNHEAPLIAPALPTQTEVLPPVDETLKPPPALTPQQAQALNTVMAEHQENDLVANLMGIWTGTMILRDLAVDHFTRETEEPEETTDGEG
jgi:hypothetical protein